MRGLVKGALASVVTISALAAGGGVAQAAEPAPSSGDSGARKEVCAFIERADYPHISDAGSNIINVHGWWEWRSGTSSSCKSKYTEAKVTVYLQSSLDGKTWTTRSQGDKTVKPGGGSNYRAVAPYTCKNFLKTKWRSRVDVDVIGLIDDPTKVNGPSTDVKCGF